MSPASALRSPGPESLGLSLQRTNVPQWGQRPGVPWDGLTFPHTCLQPLPVSCPDPDLCLLWHLWVSWGFCTRTGVLTLVVPTGARGFQLLALGCVSYQPASAFRLSRPCRHVRPALVSAPRPVLVGFCLFSPFPATGSEGRRPALHATWPPPPGLSSSRPLSPSEAPGLACRFTPLFLFLPFSGRKASECRSEVSGCAAAQGPGSRAAEMCTLVACEGAAPAGTSAGSRAHPRVSVPALSLSWRLPEGRGRAPPWAEL